MAGVSCQLSVVRGVSGLFCAVVLTPAAFAQYRAPAQHFPSFDANTQPLSGQQPVTFQADSVTYDKDHGLVSADGHVEAWQNDHVLRADRVTFDRNTNVAAAYGHVAIVEPDGQVLFADYAELSQGMRNGVLTGMRALLEQNGRLAANGARRTEGKINEMSRGVYSTCNVCALDPKKAPLWQLRARLLTQDLEHKRLEYRDATLDFLGVPVLYTAVFFQQRPVGQAPVGPALPRHRRHRQPSREFRIAPVLHRAGRPIRPHADADPGHAHRPAVPGRIPTRLQRGGADVRRRRCAR